MANYSDPELVEIKRLLREGLVNLALSASEGDPESLKELRSQLQTEEYMANLNKMDEDESAG